MSDITDGIIDLAIVQRPARPIGEAGALIHLDVGIGRNQVCVANLFAQPQRHGGDLGVEQRLRRLAGEIVDDFQILPAGVEHLQHRLFHEQLQQRRQIEIGALGIDGGGFVRAGDLHQAQIGVIGALAHELGINRDEISGSPAGAKLFESRGVRHQRMNQHGARYSNLAA